MELPKEELIQKYVIVGMRNKENMNGFVVEVEKTCIKMVDCDNYIVYINPLAIAYIKVSSHGNSAMKKVQLKPNISPVDQAPDTGCGGLCSCGCGEAKENVTPSNPRPDLAAIVSKPRDSEFSMLHSPDSSPCGSPPAFERRTKRGSEEE